MAEAFIVDALRSPTGKRNGALAQVHGADLGAHVIKDGSLSMNVPSKKGLITTGSATSVAAARIMPTIEIENTSE